LALCVAPTPFYATIVFASASLSVIWHQSDTPATSPLGIADHVLAALWFVTDCVYFWNYGNRFGTMIALQIAITLTSAGVGYLDKQGLLPYTAGHSVWHLASAAKSFYIAALLKSLMATASAHLLDTVHPSPHTFSFPLAPPDHPKVQIGVLN
jgi:hypothetical protein